MENTQDLLGKVLDASAQRDAIHIAVAPVIAARSLAPGQSVGLTKDGEADSLMDKDIGIVDPFLKAPVKRGERFFIFLYPNTATGLRHVYTHPALDTLPPEKSHSELWMRQWAKTHVAYDYYGDGGDMSEDAAYAFAVKAGFDHNIGPYESARDHIDNEWWGHWEAITGAKGNRDGYFSCAC
jgi:hypothetical protein